jgi:hypothetical protein
MKEYFSDLIKTLARSLSNVRICSKFNELLTVFATKSPGDSDSH